MEDITWTTEDHHVDNEHTMQDYIANHNMLDIVQLCGTYAEGVNSKGERYAIHASGNGDSLNHRVRFELLSTGEEVRLKDCPFCEGKVVLNKEEEEIHCTECFLSVSSIFHPAGEGLTSLVTKWNTRKDA